MTGRGLCRPDTKMPLSKRTSVLACVWSLVLIATASALGCGYCTDQHIIINQPWARYGMHFLCGWFLVMVVARLVLQIARHPAANTFVRWWTLAASALLVALGFYWLRYRLWGSFLATSLILSFLWAVFLLVRSVIGVLRLLIGSPSRASVMAVAIDLAFLFCAVAVVAHQQHLATTAEHCIDTLDYHVSATYEIAMPRIVEAGPRAVELLLGPANEALQRHGRYAGERGRFSRSRRLLATAFCLGEIGGPQAEQWLAHVVRDHVGFEDYYCRTWQPAACYAYARCAHARAVNNLIRLYESLGPAEAQHDSRVCPLMALALTGSRRGVMFVLEHMDDLLQASAMDDSQEVIVRAVAQALVFGSDPASLENLPVHRELTLAGDTSVIRRSAYAAEFYWTDASKDAIKPIAEVQAAWNADSQGIKRRWAEVLKESK